ncbi:MAG: AraC family transcriptional regulator, partial [Ginsengibacter sp.]
MESAENILAIALNHPVMQDEMELVQHSSQKIPGSVQYVINRYRKTPNVIIEETAMMVYNYNA